MCVYVREGVRVLGHKEGLQGNRPEGEKERQMDKEERTRQMEREDT